MLERESERTGITSLKISSNNVFGYYIEVRHSQKDKIPQEWIRKQTLVNAERYITEELKEYETKILGAEERILEIEQRLFAELVSWMTQFIPASSKKCGFNCASWIVYVVLHNWQKKIIMLDPKIDESL